MSAIFSSCGKYRHMLVVEGNHYCGWIMCNPSIANGNDVSDPTLNKVCGFSKDWGYDGVVLANCHDFISTDPKGLFQPGVISSSRDNDAYIQAVAMLPLIIVAWGANVDNARVLQVLSILKFAQVRPFCLGINANGSPKHPLYVPYSQRLLEYPIDEAVIIAQNSKTTNRKS